MEFLHRRSSTNRRQFGTGLFSVLTPLTSVAVDCARTAPQDPSIKIDIIIFFIFNTFIGELKLQQMFDRKNL